MSGILALELVEPPDLSDGQAIKDDGCPLVADEIQDATRGIGGVQNVRADALAIGARIILPSRLRHAVSSR
jgi:hypothetical protein